MVKEAYNWASNPEASGHPSALLGPAMSRGSGLGAEGLLTEPQALTGLLLTEQSDDFRTELDNPLHIPQTRMERPGS